MKNELTIIIPFLNEGREVYNTVKNLREKAGKEIDILLINDCSTDRYNYQIIAENFDTAYINHSHRKGVAASRDEGIALCQTPYFLLLDAHMRVFQDNWHKTIVNQLEKDARSIVCCQTVPINTKGEIIGTSSFGAYIDWKDLSVHWNRNDPDKTQKVVDIPCVLGASYSCSKDYWKYLNGLKGLRSFGYDEQLISIKVWMEGGSCKLIKEITFGHLFRNSEDVPYPPINVDYTFNALYIAELFLSPIDKIAVFHSIREKCGNHLFNEIMNIFKQDKEDILSQKKYYQSIFKRNIEFVKEKNKLAR